MLAYRMRGRLLRTQIVRWGREQVQFVQVFHNLFTDFHTNIHLLICACLGRPNKPVRKYTRAAGEKLPAAVLRKLVNKCQQLF